MTLGTFIPIFVAFLVVFFSIMITASVKSGKKKKNNQTAGAQNARPRSDGDPFAEPANTAAVKKASVRKYVKPARPVEGTDLVEHRPGVHTSAEVVGVTSSHHDKHCDVDSHEDEGLYIVEKVPVSGSIGGENDEGCREHYNLRFVKINEQENDGGKMVISPDDVRKAIILGEVINDPAYKK